MTALRMRQHRHIEQAWYMAIKGGSMENREYKVTMTITVWASNEEHAEELGFALVKEGCMTDLDNIEAEEIGEENKHD